MTVSSPDGLHIECTGILSRVYQYVSNININVPIRRDPGIFMNVSVREHHERKNHFDVA